MMTSVVMPKVGLTMTEGKIVEWKKAAGDKVEKDEVLFVFETEKVTYEVEAAQSGILVEITAGLEEVVQVGDKVAVIASDEGAGAAPADIAAASPEQAGRAESVQIRDNSAVADSNRAAIRHESSPPASNSQVKVRATPLARRIAREHGIDLSAIAATAVGGRLRRKDVEDALRRMKTVEALAIKATGVAAEPPLASRTIKLTGMRRIIADKMLASKVTTAQAYMTCSVDASKVRKAREVLAPHIEKAAGVGLTITDLLMKLTAGAISKHPIMNTRWADAGIVWLHRINMGLATALDDGLIVPVIPDIASKTLGEIAALRNALVSRGRSNSLAPEEMRGSTFTLSSLGMYGVEEFSGILNQPESAILAVGAIIDKPVSVDGEVVVRPIMKLTLTYDHRVIDGAKAGAFMMTLKETMEDPFRMLA